MFPKYRPLSEMTEEEIIEITRDILNTKPSVLDGFLITPCREPSKLMAIGDVIRNTRENCLNFLASIVTSTGTPQTYPLCFYEDKLGTVYLKLGNEHQLLYQQYLLAKGYSPLLKNNPYLETDEKLSPLGEALDNIVANLLGGKENDT